ncbi:MAG: hypothetical protein R3C44_09185 [Chloroflexota bacterium]
MTALDLLDPASECAYDYSPVSGRDSAQLLPGGVSAGVQFLTQDSLAPIDVPTPEAAEPFFTAPGRNGQGGYRSHHAGPILLVAWGLTRLQTVHLCGAREQNPVIR